uniref:Serine/arginine-rich splicing factor 12-like n=1 Tax=Dermatophagoides pteronyssinus TaxID=6956 RepID=A0A6P6Y2X0_DERPT|nr:serine/arginine-rich splicing factor 12-like [Dermatophagoides pteronyssinus]
MSHHRYDHSSSSPTFSTKPNRSLFIKRVPFQTRCQDLRSIFEEFGSIKDVYIPRDYYTGRIRGFAYVEFERIKDAEYAMRKLKHVRLWGHELQVEFAQGDRKTPTEMRIRNKHDNGKRSSISRDYRTERNYHRRNRSRSPSHHNHHHHHQKRRSFSRSRSRSPPLPPPQQSSSSSFKTYRPTSPKPSYDPRLFL